MKTAGLILVLALFQFNASIAQSISFPFSKYYDEEARIAIGMQYNFRVQNYQIRLKENWQQKYVSTLPIEAPNDSFSLNRVSSNRSPGFSVAIPIEVRLDQYWYVTTAPTFLFRNNLAVTYSFEDPMIPSIVGKNKHQLNSTDGSNFNALEFPFTLKFRSEEKLLKNKENRYRAYIVGGVRLHRWLGINDYYRRVVSEKNTAAEALILKSSFLSWEAGVGLDIFFESFRMSPEIKFNQSFGNVLDNNNALSIANKYMNPIEKAFIRNISVGLIFQ